MLTDFLTVGQQVMILFVLIAMGFLLGKTKLIGEEGIAGITNLVLYLVTPCVIIEAFQREYDPSMLLGLGKTCLIALIVHLLAILLARILIREKDRGKNKVYRFAIIFSNCGYMALPLIQTVLGSEGVFYGAAYVAVFNLVVWSYGLLMMSGDKTQLSLKKLLTNPGIMGVVVGLALFLSSVTLPEIIGKPISYMASLNTPLPMLVIGFYLTKSDLRGVWKDKYLYITAAARLLLIPGIAMAGMYLAGVRGTLLTSCTISASASSAAATTMFTSKYGGDRELSGRVVSVTTLLSVVTMPLLVAAAQSL